MLVPGLVFLLGVCVGSFTNVLVFRLPESESVVSPGSRCRACRKPLAWYENVPLVSYLALAGRCRRCRAPISVQYPLVELAVGLLFVGNFLLFGPGLAATAEEQLRALLQPEWITGAIFTTILLAIALTDLRTYLIPDELSLGGMVIGLSLSFLPGGLRPLEAVLGAFAGGVLLLGVAWLGGLVFQKEAMGGGDIKMMAMVGAFVGWQGVLLTLFIGALLGSIIYGPISVYQRLRSARGAASPEEPRVTVGSPRRGQERSVTRTSPGGRDHSAARTLAGEQEAALEAGPPDLAEEASGAPEDSAHGLVPFGFFLAPAAAVTFYLVEELVRGYLRLVGLGG